MGRRQCELEGCTKGAVSGGTPYCSGHGGGKRCQEEGCPKAAAAGGTQRCIAHGGGRRCKEPGCSKGARPGTSHCSAHGGGKPKLCANPLGTCTRLAVAGNRSGLCIFCGGGRRLESSLLDTPSSWDPSPTPSPPPSPRVFQVKLPSTNRRAHGVHPRCQALLGVYGSFKGPIRINHSATSPRLTRRGATWRRRMRVA